MPEVKKCYDAQILYEEDCSWEFSFITQELVPGFPVKLFSHRNLKSIDFSGTVRNRILVFTSNLHSYQDIADVCERIRPTIIFHLSDEWGNKPEFDKLAKRCRLYLRQYSHPSYPEYGRVKTVPLGYGVDMFVGSWANTQLTPSHKRENLWSFVGNMKSDREEMRIAFEKLGNGFFGNADKSTMKNLYLNSKFVPVGRGNVSLDCLRIYEALSAGAVPVVVGSTDEIRTTFADENTEGWVVANSWGEASELCKTMSENNIAMNKKQALAVGNWRNRLVVLRNKIHSKMYHNL